jgi:DNA adenine methylase
MGEIKYRNAKAPFGRMGGKYFNIKELISHMPNNIEKYIEPFLGSGVVFFSMLDKYNPSKIILNDLDNEVITVMRGLKEDSEYINDNMKRGKISRDEFEELKKEDSACNIIARFKNSILGKGIDFNNGRINPNITNYVPFGNKLKHADIYCCDFKDIISNNNSEEAFFYLDPPYENSKKCHYTYFDTTPESVLDAVKDIKGKFMLSYNDSPNIRELFKDYNIIEFKKNYSPTNHISSRCITELIIKNY